MIWNISSLSGSRRVVCLGYCSSRWHIRTHPVWTVMATVLLVTACYPIMPESVRWQVCKKKNPAFAHTAAVYSGSNVERHYAETNIFRPDVDNQRYDLQNQSWNVKCNHSHCGFQLPVVLNTQSSAYKHICRLEILGITKYSIYSKSSTQKLLVLIQTITNFDAIVGMLNLVNTLSHLLLAFTVFVWPHFPLSHSWLRGHWGIAF